MESLLLEGLKSTFYRWFNYHSQGVFFAPGRVNLIGEHLDYNGGYVFPCAIDLGTYAVVSPRTDKIIRCYSANYPTLGVIEFSLERLSYFEGHNWANYPKGVLKVFADYGYRLNHGLDIVYGGDIPNGAGLSSSASIEVLTANIIKEYGGFIGIDDRKIALYSQEAENKFIGVNCGIMDQFAIAFGKKDHAILLDCNTLNYKYAPLKLDHYTLIIANTNKKRNLADSKYNQRKSECDTALVMLQSRLKINSLGELNVADLEANSSLIDDPIKYNRAYHVVTENQRTKDAVEALEGKDIIKFGKLINQSHVSLRDYYNVTGYELDSLVNAAWSHRGCVGARMTGAGFGGCTVNLVDSSQVEDFIATVGEQYTKATSLNPEFYVVKVSDGAKRLMA